MVFTAALRRASSAAAPLAIRALGGSRRSHNHAPLCSLPLRTVFSREPLGPGIAPLSPPFSRFSTQAKKPASDADLLRVIDSEIKCAEECDDHDRVEEIPDRFPFEIHDDKGMNIITLKRTYQSENIEVIVSMPSLVTGEEPENDREADDGDEDGDGDEKANQSSIPLTVNITKGNGPSLEFTCTAYPDEITIDSMSVSENKGTDEEMIAYEGPDFNDLDENLQKAFHKYLEIRGISPITTNFLHEFMINKDSREYLLWLKNLKEFIQK